MASIPMSRFEKRMIVIPKLKVMGLEIDDKISWYEITQLCEGNDINVTSLLKHPVPKQEPKVIVTPVPKNIGFVPNIPEPAIQPIIVAEDEDVQELPQENQVQEDDNPKPVDDEEYLV